MDRVLVERIAPATKSVGGVLLPESMTGNTMNEAKVIAAGPGRRTMSGELVPLEIKVGDVVALPEFGGAAVNAGDGSGKEYFIYREEEIVGVVE
ncbi:co-chaperonin 10, mitochondrial [Ostreococcus lucimarinus CCE9901]|uniref:Co-chaperonin 10, mitochondrial n=1 Tax=Ostreococcus lucimarinus (strain CCE9901) TaxID=436017 RepID=A4S8D8_OSTLU|nr:co-chaperonin 10, mitochondrial [Ostreococcus lucimarinus CCE9901]ABO99895.1 co-chaperonin 10, mitochondrial [Ostreococcus lucimarinus CCE9901]|eukprot:XP_001421602.1 co-chaperonin 10, mitochondrial [Ostreococcus lucimarinus CCE9901]